MKNKMNNKTVRQIIRGVAGGVSLLLFVGLTVFQMVVTGGLAEQQMAKRWSNAGETTQVSCFFSRGTEVTENTIKGFQSKVKNTLQQESITSESTNPGARMWADAYSGVGQITMENSGKTLTAKAIGVGGDFFLFHPLQLLYGSLFSGNDGMLDYVVLDEEAAWQLFGSNDVAGMRVMIGGVPHIISGVIERGNGRLNDAAGNGDTTVYMSYQSLELYGESQGISCYEIVLPNPITGYGLQLVKEKIGLDEKNVECVENTTRFSVLSIGAKLLEFGSRSMSQKAIIYPYWENVARGWEDIFTLLLLFRIIFLLIPIIMIVIVVVKLWKRRTWSFRDIPKLLKRFGTLLRGGVKGVLERVKSYKKKTEKEADFE